MTAPDEAHPHSARPLTADPLLQPRQPAAPPAPAPGPEGRPRRRLRWLLAGALVLVLAAVLMARLPQGKVIESPGPTWDVLASTPGADGQPGTDLIAVSGAPTYATSGQMRMTTVSVSGCPGHPITGLDVIVAWLSPDQRVVDREQICPASLSQQDIDEQSHLQMTSSQDSAVLAALMESGAATSMTLTINGGTTEQAQALFQEGDVLREITVSGTKTTLTSFVQLRELLAATPVGTPVELGLERGGQPTSVQLTTQPPQEEGRAGSVLGVLISAKADSQVEATFALQDVGGPSAGMMFALGIVDKLTPGPMLSGQDLAGTGTIDIAGKVGPIGGVVQKMKGAARDGATVFLAPAANCDEVVGNEPEGLTVVPVSTLHEAVEAATLVGQGSTAGLRSCQAVLSQD